LAISTMLYVYLLASQPQGTLYAGMTDDLVRRVWEHKIKAVSGFTAKSAWTDSSGSKFTKLSKEHCAARSRSRSGDGRGKSL